MRDTSATPFRASRTAPRAAMAAVLLAIAFGLGGCANGSAGSGSFAMAGDGPTVAFESIDATPPRGGECGAAFTGLGCIARQRAGLQRPLTQNSLWTLILRRKT